MKATQSTNWFNILMQAVSILLNQTLAQNCINHAACLIYRNTTILEKTSLFDDMETKPNDRLI